MLNTLASSYPPTPLIVKILQSLNRILTAWFAAANHSTCGFIAFSGFGLSLYERVVIALVFRFYGIRSVLFFRSSEILARPIAPFYLGLLGFVLRIPSICVAQGTQLAVMISGLSHKQVHVIPNWLPPECLVANQPKCYPLDNVVKFVYVGWLERSKGVIDLLAAVSILKPLSNRFSVVFLGGGSLEAQMHELIKTKCLSNVSVPGWSEREYVQTVLEDSHVFVLPSHTEGFPNSLLEAMANGLPAITTRVGGIPDSVNNGVEGYLVDVEDPPAIALAMRKYIENPSLISRHSRASLSRVRGSHGYETNCLELLKLLS